MAVISFQEKLDKYSEYFDPDSHMEAFFPGFLPWDTPDYLEDNVVTAMRFKVRAMQSLITKAIRGKTSRNLKCLDLATGPYIGTQMFLASCTSVAEITCTDLLGSNRYYVQKIIDGGSTRFDWEKFSEWAHGIPTGLDGFRAKCKNVLEIDMISGKGYEKLGDIGPFDLITSEWSFCDSTLDLKNYGDNLKAINKLLPLGGSLVFLDLLEESFWVPNPKDLETRCPTVCVTVDWLKSALEAAGFVVEEVNVRFYHPPETTLFDARGNVVIWATKIKILDDEMI